MRPHLLSIFAVLLLAACSDTGREATGIETALDPSEIADQAPVTMTEEQRASTPFDAELFVSTIDQLLYVLPVTRGDVIDELSIILEGQTGELVDLQTIRTCLSGYSEERPDADILEEVSAQAQARWSTLVDEEATAEAASFASITFDGCVSYDRTGCYQSCEAYAAAASTIVALPYVNADSGND